MYRNYELYLKDILSAIGSIEKFVKDMDFEKFERDDKTSSAVIRKFEIIGEATAEFDLVAMETGVGGRRILATPIGDPVPRIC